VESRKKASDGMRLSIRPRLFFPFAVWENSFSFFLSFFSFAGSSNYRRNKKNLLFSIVMSNKRKAIHDDVTAPTETHHADIRVKRSKPAVMAAAAAAPEKEVDKPEVEEITHICYLHRECATMSFDMNGLHVLGIPKKTHVFRGSKEGDPMFFAPAAHRPTYFANVDTARVYAGGNDSRCLAYRTTRDLRLLDMSDEFNIHELHKRLEGEERQALEILTGYGRTRLTFEEVPMLHESCYYDRKPSKEIRICTAGFLTDAHREQGDYISKQVARIVCKLKDIDGWVFGLMYRRGNGEPFHAEVMLCNPAGVIETVMQSCESLEFETLVNIRRRFGLKSIEQLQQLMRLFHALSRWKTPEREFEQFLATSRRGGDAEQQ
jgi:hypothetical protein